MNSVSFYYVQQRLGRGDLKTTSIGADATGEEDRIAERIWGAHG